MTPMRLATLLLWVASCVAFASAARARDPSFGLPPLKAPAASDAQRELGRKLFFDRRLSINGTMSCGMCHVPEEGFTSNASQQALGLEGRSLKRNAPGLLNVAWQAALFHDGRQASLEGLAWEPLLHPHEMGNASAAQVLARLRRLDDYPRRVAAAFPGRGMTRDTVSRALAAYQRTLVAADSPFDRWRYGGHADALDVAAREGFALFVGKARCTSCHLVGERDATFTDGGFHVTGAGHALQAHYDVPLAPGQATRVPLDALAPFAFGAAVVGGADLGRFDVTRQARDRHAFKTPSLRNVSRTAPYMHDGSLATLDAVIDFYDRGGGRGVEGRSALLQPLELTAGEKSALRAFLESLDSPHAQGLIIAARHSTTRNTMNSLPLTPDSVVRFLNRFEELAEKENFDLVEDMIHEQAVFRFNDGDFVGRAAIRAAFEKTWKGTPNVKKARFYLSDIRVLSVDRASATATYTYHWEGTMDGKPFAIQGRGTRVLVVEAGRVQIIHEHLSRFPR